MSTDQNERSFIDLEHIVTTNENPKWSRLLEVTRERANVTAEEKRLKEVKDKLNEEIKELLERFDIDGVVAGDIIVETAKGGTSGRWNATRLFQILTPESLKEVYTEGRSYTYVKSSRNEKRARKLVD
jgi:hypothetical protein